MRTGNSRQLARRRAIAWTITCVLALTIAACHHAPPPPSNATPEKAVATNLRLTAMGDFDGLMKNRLPAAAYVRWREEWGQSHAQPVPASVAQQKQFAKIMRMLTEPGAEAKLARRLQPELSRLRGDKNSPAPIFTGILEAAGKQMIAASPQLGPAQRTLAGQGLDALIAWARTSDFSDTKKARRAIDLICATARQLHVQTLDQWRALDFAATMKNYGIIWNGLENLLQIYGLDVGQSLLDAKVTAVSDDGSHATVKLDMTFAGKPLTGEWPLLKQQGHWYDEALLTAWRKAHPVSSASVAGPASSGTAATPIPSASASSTATPTSAATPVPSRTTQR
jgi:hypothetical protein